MSYFKAKMHQEGKGGEGRGRERWEEISPLSEILNTPLRVSGGR